MRRRRREDWLELDPEGADEDEPNVPGQEGSQPTVEPADAEPGAPERGSREARIREATLEEEKREWKRGK